MMRFFALLLILSIFSIAHAAVYDLNGSQVIGEMIKIKSKPGDTHISIARQYNMGLDEIALANGRVNFKDLQPGTEIIIPSQFILPNVEDKRIVINLAEKRMYHFLIEQNQVATYPVTIGRSGWPTPRINATIVQKKENPYWIPPESIRAYALKTKGVKLPKAIPPGPNNPLGEYMLRLSSWKILIHGTNEPNKMGVRLSSGCIRMYPEDIKELFHNAHVGDSVKIIDSPYKVAFENNVLMVESQLSLFEFWQPKEIKLKSAFVKTIEDAVNDDVVLNWDKLNEYIDIRVGYPLTIEDFAY